MNTTGPLDVHPTQTPKHHKTSRSQKKTKSSPVHHLGRYHEHGEKSCNENAWHDALGSSKHRGYDTKHFLGKYHGEVVGEGGVTMTRKPLGSSSEGVPSRYRLATILVSWHILAASYLVFPAGAHQWFQGPVRFLACSVAGFSTNICRT